MAVLFSNDAYLHYANCLSDHFLKNNVLLYGKKKYVVPRCFLCKHYNGMHNFLHDDAYFHTHAKLWKNLKQGEHPNFALDSDRVSSARRHNCLALPYPADINKFVDCAFSEKDHDKINGYQFEQDKWISEQKLQYKKRTGSTTFEDSSCFNWAIFDISVENDQNFLPYLLLKLYPDDNTLLPWILSRTEVWPDAEKLFANWKELHA